MDTEDRAYDFSVRVAELVRYLRENEKYFPLSERLLICGVSAGLAVRNGNNKNAAKCIEEAAYIIEMAERSGYLTARQAKPIRSEGQTLLLELKQQRIEEELK